MYHCVGVCARVCVWVCMCTQHTCVCCDAADKIQQCINQTGPENIFTQERLDRALARSKAAAGVPDPKAISDEEWERLTSHTNMDTLTERGAPSGSIRHTSEQLYFAFNRIGGKLGLELPSPSNDSTRALIEANKIAANRISTALSSRHM